MEKSPDAFRTISEVAEWLETPAHVLRFWESRFTQVKPVKRAGGRRYYRPSDMALLGGIKKLLHEDGMTIRGVQKVLREKGVKHVAGLAQPLDGTPEAQAEGGIPAPEAPIIEDATPVEHPSNVVSLNPSAKPKSKPQAPAPQLDLFPGEGGEAVLSPETPAEDLAEDPAPPPTEPSEPSEESVALADAAPAEDAPQPPRTEITEEVTVTAAEAETEDAAKPGLEPEDPAPQPQAPPAQDDAVTAAVAAALGGADGAPTQGEEARPPVEEAAEAEPPADQATPAPEVSEPAPAPVPLGQDLPVQDPADDAINVPPLPLHARLRDPALRARMGAGNSDKLAESLSRLRALRDRMQDGA